MAGIDHIYRYANTSSLQELDGGYNLQLAADVSSTFDNSFFSGRLLQPLITARCLRTLSDVVGTRYYIPPSMLARILREADPVATITKDALYFEGFSACCSTYVRLDMTEGSFDADTFRPGTTNVDFGADMRAALAKIRDTSALQLVVDSDTVLLEQAEHTVVEKKVPLPVRWIKGFAAVQSHLAGMSYRFSLSRIQTQRFLRSLPRAKADHEQWVVPSAHGARISTRKTANGVMIKGAQRLHTLEKLAVQANETRAAS